MNKGLTIVGCAMLLMGALWALQGVGLVGGSFMTGQRQWLLIGIITGVAGLGVLLAARFRRS